MYSHLQGVVRAMLPGKPMVNSVFAKSDLRG